MGWGWRGEWGIIVYNGFRVSIWDDEKVLEMDCSDGYTIL